MASNSPARTVWRVLGSAVFLVLLLGVLLFLDGKRLDMPSTAERLRSGEPAVPTPSAPSTPAESPAKAQ